MEIGKLYNLTYMIAALVLMLFIWLGYRKKIKIANALRVNFSKMKYLQEILLIIGVVLIVFSLTEPKKETGIEKVERDGVDIYFLIDISKSMMCNDLKPSRLERSRESIKKIIESLNGDRVGFIPFSSAAYIQMPLTDDYDMAYTFLDMIDSTLISGGGTNISSAIDVADGAFENSKSSEKVVIIFSDGEDEEEKKLQKKEGDKKRVYAVSVGTKTGGVVPEIDESGNIAGFKNDGSGNPVISKVREENLKNIAETYGGKVYTINTTTDNSDKIISELASANKGKIKEEEKKIYKQYYQYFLGSGILLLLIGYFGILFKRKNSK